MSWSNLNPNLVYIMLIAIAFFSFVAFIATRDHSPFGNHDITKYTSTFNIKSTLLTHLTTWINSQPGDLNEICKTLNISTEKLEVIIKGRVDLLSVDDLIDLLIKTGQKIDILIQPTKEDS